MRQRSYFQLTNNIDQAVEMLESESFNKFVKSLELGFVRVFTNRADGLCEILAMPILRIKADSELFLTLLQIYIRDALLYTRCRRSHYSKR